MNIERQRTENGVVRILRSHTESPHLIQILPEKVTVPGIVDDSCKIVVLRQSESEIRAIDGQDVLGSI